MKKLLQSLKVVLALFSVFLGANAFGQVANYTFSQSTGAYTPITGGTLHGTAADDANYSFTIPFTFTYNGTGYTVAKPSSNGFLVLGSNAPSTTQYTPLSSGTTNFAISALARDLISTVRSEVLGSAPNRIYVCQWSSAYRIAVGLGENINVQVRLYEGTNKIEIVYGSFTTTNTTLTTGTMQIGLRGSASTDFNNRTTTTNWAATNAGGANAATMAGTTTVLPSSGHTYTWSPPIITVDMASTAIVGIPASGCADSSVPLSVTIKNNGASTIDFSTNKAAVSVAITGASTQTLSATVNSGTLASGASQTVVVSPNANFSVGGTYNLAATVTVTGDGVAGNNTFSTTKDIAVSTTAPYTQTFPTTAVPTGWNTTGWLIGTTHAVTTSGIYKNVYTVGTALPFNTIVIGPISATSELKFDYRIVNYTSYPTTATPPGWGNFIVQVSTDCGGTFSNLQTINDANHVTSSSWATKTISLTSYSGQNVQVRILPSWTTGDYYLDFDNFSIAPTVTCQIPILTATTSIGSTTATINWTAPTIPPTNGYNYEIRTSGAAGSGATGLSASGSVLAGVTTANIASLTAATTYSVYVQSNCGGSTSTWTAAGTFVTACAIPNAPANITFTAVTSAATTVNWSASSPTSTGYVVFRSTSATPPVLTNGTVYSVNQTGVAITNGSNTYYCVYNGTGTSGAATSLTANTQYYYYIFSRNGTNGTAPDCNGAPWYSTSNLNASQITCPNAPAAAANPITNLSTNSATVNWLAPVTGGTAATLNYTIEVSTNPGFSAPIAGSPFNAGTGFNYGFSGLAGNTTHYYRVKANNGCDSPDLTGSFFTGYCATTNTGNATFINSFSTSGGLSNNISNNSSGYTNTGYQDNYATMSVDSYIGNNLNYSFTLAGGTAGVAIWVDWNNNLLFETSERVYNSAAYLGNGTYTGSIIVPAGTLLGNYRLRIKTDFNSQNPDPCTNSGTRTEAEDYKITVSSAPDYQVYTSATSPNNTVNNTIDVYLKDFDGVNNFYTDNQTSIWMYAGVRTSTNNFQFTGTTSPVQDINNTTTLVEFVRTATNPNIYKANLKFADYFCIPTGTTVTGIDLLFRNQLWDVNDYGGNNNNKTANLFLDLDDGFVAVNPPTIGTASAITPNSAIIGWTAPNSGAIKGYDFYYSTSNTTPTAGTNPSGNTAAGITTANLNSLLSGTTYYFWARTKSCDGVSVWSAAAGTFTTLCNVTPITVTEGFNAATIPTCWKKQIVPSSTQTATKITFVTTSSSPILNPIESTHMVKYDANSNSGGTSGSEERLISLPMSSLGSASVDIEFDWANSNDTTYTNISEGVQVEYSLDGITWTSTGSFIPRHDGTLPAGSASWSKKTITVPSALGNQTIFYVSLKFHSEWGRNMYVDRFVVKPTPAPITVTSSETLPVCSGTPTTLTASSTAAYTYTWSPATGLNNTTGASVIATPATTTTYIVTGTLGENSTTKSITVTVNPVPSAIMLTETPVSTGGPTACDLDYVKLDAVGGTTSVNIINENFEGSAPGWTNENYSDGGTIANAAWKTVSSPYASTTPINIGSKFKISDSDKQGSGGNYTLTYLDAPVIDTRGYSNLSLNFDQFFKVGFSGFDEARVLVSTDNLTFTEVASYVTAQGNATAFLNTTIDLSAYINKPTLFISFEYYAEYDYYWALDNIKISGDKQQVAWSPTIGLYTDPALTTPYISGFATTVYASPDTAQTYTASATNGICPINSSATASIEITKKNFTGTVSNLWNLPGNWTKNSVPTATKCVNIPSGKTAVVNINDAVAKNVTVAAGGKLTINPLQTLTVQSTFINNAALGDVVIESDGNLIQNDDVTNVGPITVKRTANIKRLDYVYWTSPVKGQKLKDFSPGTLDSRFYTYNEWNDEFTIMPSASNFGFNKTGFESAAKGYAIRASNTQSTTATNWLGVFKGEPNNGDISFALAYQSGTNPVSGNGYNLVGNPYPSNINFDQLVDNTLSPGNQSSIYTVAYFWTNTNPNGAMQGSGYPKNGLINNYAIYNGTGGVAATGAVNDLDPSQNSPIPDGNIKVGQAFIVKARQAGKNLVFNNKIRTSTSGSFFDKSSPVDRYWLQLTTPLNVQTTTLIGYKQEASNDFELDYDAPLLVLGADALFSTLETKKLAIQGRQYPLITTDIVPLGTSQYEAGNYTLSLGNREGIFANGQNIYLKDKQTNTITNLSENNYIFNANAGLTEGRFEIIYQNDIVLSTGDTKKDDLIVYRDGNDFVLKSEMKKISEVELYDTAGRLLLKLTPNQTEVRIDSSTLISAVYVLKIIRGGEVSSKKITK